MLILQEKLGKYKKSISYIGCLIMLVGFFLPLFIVESDMRRNVGIPVSVMSFEWRNIVGINTSIIRFVIEKMPILIIINIMLCVYFEKFKILIITSLVYIGMLIRNFENYDELWNCI